MSEQFFVFSAGRSGTTSLKIYLSYAKNAVVLHEPSPGTQEYLDGYVENQKLGCPFAKEDMYKGFREEAVNKVNSKGLIFGELTPMLGYVAEGALKAFPLAKVVWVLRDPLTWVRSAMHTNVRNADFKEICHHWYDLMKNVEAGYNLATEQNRCIIKIEDCKPSYLYKLYKWLDLGPQHSGARDWMKQDFREHHNFGPIWAPHPDDWLPMEWEAYNLFIKPYWEELLQRHKTDGLGKTRQR